MSKKHIGLTGINPEFLRGLWESQNGKCAFTGIPMKLPDIPKDTGHTVSFKQSDNLLFAASLDRINSNLPYCKENVHFVCRFVNLGKGTSTNEQVIEFLESYKKFITQ